MKIVIAGGGISGLSLAYFLLKENPALEVEIYERERMPGGKIRTERERGFLCESGVNGFLNNKPRTLELASALGLSPLQSNDNARKRYLFSEGKLRSIPEKPSAFFKSDLLSLRGRLRILYEPFAAKGKADDETLEQFAVRRLGREAYEKLIDPMASGIYAGDSSRLSLRSCFPRIYELEKTYGSLIRAMGKLKKEPREPGREVSAGPGGILTSFHSGIQEIIDALRHELGPRLKLGSGIVSIEKRGGGYVLFLSDGLEIETDIAVLASPAHSTSKIVKSMDKDLSAVLEKIPYPSAAVVCLGYKREKIARALDGFGFLIPGREKRGILGTLWDSSIFPDRAPSGHVLLRTILGGARNAAVAAETDEKIAGSVLDELKVIIGITAEPDFMKIYRHQFAIPQYNLGHRLVLAELKEANGKFPGLFLSGNAYRGIGLNDCIENAVLLKNRILGL